VLECTPFKVLYGYEAPLLVTPKLLGIEDREIADWIAERNAFSIMLKEQLARAQLRMKQYADKGRTPREFQVGDLVLLKLQPYTQKTMVNQPYPKLAFKYFGPFKVILRIGVVAYKLELPGECTSTSGLSCVTTEAISALLFSSFLRATYCGGFVSKGYRARADPGSKDGEKG
jgi:hypothetical protein